MWSRHDGRRRHRSRAVERLDRVVARADAPGRGIDVVVQNLGSYKVTGLREGVEARSAGLLLLPPDSSDLKRFSSSSPTSSSWSEPPLPEHARHSSALLDSASINSHRPVLLNNLTHAGYGKSSRVQSSNSARTATQVSIFPSGLARSRQALAVKNPLEPQPQGVGSIYLLKDRGEELH